MLSGTTTATGSADLGLEVPRVALDAAAAAGGNAQAGPLLREEKASETKRKKGDGKGKKGNRQQQKTGASGDTAGADNG